MIAPDAGAGTVGRMAPTPTFVSSLQLARARAAGRGPAERVQGPAAVAKLRPSVGPVTPAFEHQIVRLDVSGRLRLGRLQSVLGWDTDARLGVAVEVGTVTGEPALDGDVDDA